MNHKTSENRLKCKVNHRNRPASNENSPREAKYERELGFETGARCKGDKTCVKHESNRNKIACDDNSPREAAHEFELRQNHEASMKHEAVKT